MNAEDEELALRTELAQELLAKGLYRRVLGLSPDRRLSFLRTYKASQGNSMPEITQVAREVVEGRFNGR